MIRRFPYGQSADISNLCHHFAPLSSRFFEGELFDAERPLSTYGGRGGKCDLSRRFLVSNGSCLRWLIAGSPNTHTHAHMHAYTKRMKLKVILLRFLPSPPPDKRVFLSELRVWGQRGVGSECEATPRQTCDSGFWAGNAKLTSATNLYNFTTGPHLEIAGPFVLRSRRGICIELRLFTLSVWNVFSVHSQDAQTVVFGHGKQLFLANPTPPSPPVCLLNGSW